MRKILLTGFTFLVSVSSFASVVNCSLQSEYGASLDDKIESTCSINSLLVDNIYIGSCLLHGKNASGETVIVRVSELKRNSNEIRVDTRAIKIEATIIRSNEEQYVGGIRYLHAKNNSYENLSSPVLGGMTLRCE